MEFRQLEALKLIAETGSFSEAARQMDITQPSVSAQINALERELGTRLLTRLPGKAVPNETGRTLCRYAGEILALRERALEACSRARGMSGTVAIAASSIPYQYVLPVLTAQFSLKHPDARFSLCGGDSANAAKQVLCGEADLGMAGTIIPSENLVYEAILEDELVALTPSVLPYTDWPRRLANTEDILRAPFIAREEGSGTWAEVERWLDQQRYDGGALNIVAWMDNTDAIVNAVEQGMGITILSSLAASEAVRKRAVLAFPLAGEPVKRKLYLVRAKARKLPPAACAFARFVLGGDGER